MLDLENMEKSENIEAPTTEEVNETVNELLESLKQLYAHITSEEEGINYIKRFIESTINTADYFEEFETERDIDRHSITELDAIEYYRESLPVTITLIAFSRNEWSTERIGEAIVETVHRFYDSSEQLDFTMDFHLFGDRSEELVRTTNKKLTEEAELIEIENYFTRKVDTLYYTKDKISNNLVKLPVGEQLQLALESTKDKRKRNEVTTIVSINFDTIEDSDEISDQLRTITDYDKEVFNAIVTEWENGNTTTTAQSLYRIMSKNLRARVPAEQETAILESVRKLSTARMRIDATAERVYYGEELSLVIEGHLIAISIDTANINGNLVYNAIHILDLHKTPLYRYAKIKKQIASVPFKLLTPDTPKVNMNEETRRIYNYLLERVESIGSISSTIRVSAIFEAAKIYEADYKNFKDKRAKTMKKITDILEGWIETGFIKGYTLNKKSRAVDSITIKK